MIAFATDSGVAVVIRSRMPMWWPKRVLMKALSSAIDTEFTPNDAIVSCGPTCSCPDSMPIVWQMSAAITSAVSSWPVKPAPGWPSPRIHRPVRMKSGWLTPPGSWPMSAQTT